jgi:excisionase family DNA binding protein
MSKMKEQQILIVTDSQQLADTIEKVLANRQAAKPEPEFNERMTRAEAARFAGVSYLTFGKWIHAGLIPEHGVGKKRFFYRQEVIAALQKQG